MSFEELVFSHVIPNMARDCDRRPAVTIAQPVHSSVVSDGGEFFHSFFGPLADQVFGDSAHPKPPIMIVAAVKIIFDGIICLATTLFISEEFKRNPNGGCGVNRMLREFHFLFVPFLASSPSLLKSMRGSNPAPFAYRIFPYLSQPSFQPEQGMLDILLVG